MLSTAQTINISGVVQDTGGVGIAGATVKLEKANLSTTSGTGGVFTLTGIANSAKPRSMSGAIAGNPVQFRNGRIAFSLCGNTSVGISIHDIGGRQVFGSKQTLGSGAHSIRVPEQSPGIYLCKVTIGHESYSFKASSFGASLTKQGVVSNGVSALGKQAKSAAVISDVIAATSTGKLNYRCVITNSDTSGVVIKMLPNAGNATDADGNVYQSVRLGTQVWTVENLRTTKYNDGTPIPHVTVKTHWSNLTTPGYCFYNNSTDAAYQEKWGALYNWYAVNTGKLAPAGWHVPTVAEWDTLRNYLIGNGYNWDGTMSGNKIGKSLASKTDWSSSSSTGEVGNDLTSNNRTGFSALPGGCRGSHGNFNGQSNYGFWWSATELDASNAYFRPLYYDFQVLARDYLNKWYGFSVRLVRDLN